MKSEKVQLSVIVPVYNVEQYLKQCIDSILNQTFKNFELILVDDESPDNCPQICDDYASKYSQIKVVHQKNTGLAGARNSGFEHITGQYVYFLDSDDIISSKISNFYLLFRNHASKSSCFYFSFIR